ncbi:hypothetical protein [uncultured Nonlabens sp.]|uniref:hypothetical protein n=1 Tax=uncultured Nonlabens sp. TaxID=859306 RepID=UPI00262B34CE|nr:hypothetical protein [uncultured Nonlabens sp.]
MRIEKLHIFETNTDATASLRGYNYQILKTVESWVENFLLKKDDEIYCDFEEDIFEKDTIAKEAKFRQIKLYSKNFSFSSEEVNKCIAHFFMLHAKTDYQDYDKSFVFEANTNVAQKKGDNDAELLREWYEHQDSFSEELQNRCAAKVKSIVSDYITKRTKALEDKVEDSVLEEATEIFDALTENDWVNFTKLIKWDFKNIDPESEFINTKSNIETLLLQLPFQIDKSNVTAAFGLLIAKAWDKASETNPVNKKLTSESLTELLVKIAEEDFKWYWECYYKWKDAVKIDSLVTGEFFEIIDAIRFCRHNPVLLNHSNEWARLLTQYIELPNIDDQLKRNAVYELLWLNLKPIDYNTIPEGSVKGMNDYFDFYFQDFEIFQSSQEIEDAQSLINIAFAATAFDKSDLTMEVVKQWFDDIEKIILKRLDEAQDPNQLCHLLENLATHYLFLEAGNLVENELSILTKPLYKILSHIDDAQLYNITSLNNRLNTYIKLLIQNESEKNEGIIEALEHFIEKIEPIVSQRYGAYGSAKVEIQKGIEYLKSTNPNFSLKALNSFHKAKSLWYLEESFEGYVLALINIAQLYASIGLNMAAKYYAISALWASAHKGDSKMLKRIADSLSIVFHSDFKQGSWMSAILSFADYLNARNEFRASELDAEIDIMPFKAMQDLAFIFYVVPKIEPNLDVLITYHKGLTSKIAEGFVPEVLTQLETLLPDNDAINNSLVNKLTDSPINDVGSIRNICFNALGIRWEIQFSNTFEMNAVSEEFCGVMQIVLAEVALSKTDFHLIRGGVSINLEMSDVFKAPKLQPSNEKIEWTVYVKELDTTEKAEIVMNTSFCVTAMRTILSNLSLLEYEEYSTAFIQLFEKTDLSGKTLQVGLYQRMYRSILPRAKFDSLQREHFDSVSLDNVDLPATNQFMKWDDSISAKYDKALFTSQIDLRFKRLHKNSHITISKLLKNDVFIKLVKDLRIQGWQDWHIFLSINNFILDYKSNKKLEDYTFKSEEEYRSKKQEIFNEIREQDENDFYIEFPIEAFTSDEFAFQMKHTIPIILESFGLVIPSKYPNFEAIKEFLDIRFNMAEDGSGGNSPFENIE